MIVTWYDWSSAAVVRVFWRVCVRRSFGTVLQCIKRIDNQVYAVKKSLRPLESESMLR